MIDSQHKTSACRFGRVAPFAQLTPHQSHSPPSPAYPHNNPPPQKNYNGPAQLTPQIPPQTLTLQQLTKRKAHRVLNIDTVAKALMAYHSTGDWARALEATLPKRQVRG